MAPARFDLLADRACRPYGAPRRWRSLLSCDEGRDAKGPARDLAFGMGLRPARPARAGPPGDRAIGTALWPPRAPPRPAPQPSGTHPGLGHGLAFRDPAPRPATGPDDGCQRTGSAISWMAPIRSARPTTRRSWSSMIRSPSAAAATSPETAGIRRRTCPWMGVGEQRMGASMGRATMS